MLDIDSQIEQLSVQKFDLQAEVDKNRKKQIAAAKALVLVGSVPSKVSQMRNHILRKMGQAKSENITVAKSKHLASEVASLQTQLQKICTHPFIYLWQGYQGDHLHEYENRRPDHRLCIVCGISEDGKLSNSCDGVGTKFEVLVDADNRIVENGPWTSGGIKRVDIWIPLGAVLHPFEEDVAQVLNS